MSEHKPDEHANNDPSKPDQDPRSRPPALTAEQRRLLGKPRPVHDRSGAEKGSTNETGAARHHEPSEFQSASEEEKLGRSATLGGLDDKSARGAKPWRAFLVIGVIAALLLTFYVGKKFDYWRYLWATRNRPKLGEQIPDKYPGVPANELVEQGLIIEHTGRWSDASELFIAAKHKDLQYRGILFRVGKLAYDKGDFDTADRLFARALAFGENIDAANYLRGVIATRRRDFPAAERFFEAATTAEPFVPDYYYYWAEALRLNHRPHDAIQRYEQAARRTRDDQDQTVCQFKVRMARLESGEDEKLKAEIEEQRRTGLLPLDWLLTEAGIAIGDNRIDDAVRSIMAARTAIPTTENGGGIFLSCTSDGLFQNACRKHPLLADACDVKTTSP